ncbi:MAG: hypothetical protein QOE28_1646 [Solirubrobacteraceae bacterium]|jgi:hypothetical protein|nr:hypothetical protein [Solirubrobacteraceae bacterium]
MPVATLRDEVVERSRAFAWDQWTQLGVSGAAPADRERRAADPEALLLFTLEVGRHDPRLFDEVLDWLVLNEQLVSVQRLRNLCVDGTDRSLVDGALGAVARSRPRARLASRTPERVGVVEPLFHGIPRPKHSLDPAFERAGFARARFAPSGKSQGPDLLAPISLALRLRRLLGVGARAEVARVLLTIDGGRATTGVVQAAAGFSRTNVREALTQLHDAGVARERAADRAWSMRPEAWWAMLGVETPSTHREWPQILGPIRLVLRWLADERTGELSDYMRASAARVFLDAVRPDLRFAGIDVPRERASGAEFWETFEREVRATLAAL